MVQPRHRSTITSALESVAREHPFGRKLVLCRRLGEGREALRSLSASGFCWAGFEVMTPWQLAQSLVGDRLAVRGLRVVDEFEQVALTDEAIDAVLDDASGRLAALAEGAGLRRSIASAIQALRFAGIDAAALARTRFRDEDKRVQMSRIVAAYEKLLDTRGITDAAGVFRLAVASLAVGEVDLEAAAVCVMPGHSSRGLPGQLLSLFVEKGAIVLPEAPVHGLPRPAHWIAAGNDSASHGDDHVSALAWLHDVANAPPESSEVELFAATSVASEVREILRRVVALGVQWDEVEIITTDPLTYGVALDEIAQRLNIPVTYAVGLPVSRTRPGRAVAKFVEWIQLDFPADVIRGMLERGDIAIPGARLSGMDLARRLRRMKIARGRDRYAAAIARALRAAGLPQREGDERTPEEAAIEKSRMRAEVEALRTILDPIFTAMPALPDRFTREQSVVEPAAIARAILAMLAFVPHDGPVDDTAWNRIRERLGRLEKTSTRATTLDGAIATVMGKLDARVPAPDAAGGAPWTSAGGHLHLSDIDHGGFTQRRATFVAGLDAMRFPGSGLQDALLVDDDRRRLSEETAGSGLPTAAERVEEKRYALGSMLARLQGSVTLSYSTWDAVEGRAIAPASEMLQAYRLVTHEPHADYDAMHRALAPAASAVPRGSALLDADDVWLAALADGGLLRNGKTQILEAFRGLGAGYHAGESKNARQANAFHGVITPRKSLDPRVNETMVVSSTELQTLGTCPHRYLLRHVLRIRKPEDPDVSAEQWLSPLERGSLLHEVFERTLRAFDDRRDDVDSREFENVAMRTADDCLNSLREYLPPPGAAIFEAESELVRDDVRAFVAMLREDGARWIDVERTFGRDGVEPVSIDLAGSQIRVNGRIDRIDRLDDGSLLIVDYKTGSRLRFGSRQKDYDGGRRLQHVIYAAVAERLHNAPVSRAEYQFPSRRSENHRAKYGQPALRNGLRIVDQLLTLVERGHFYPTNDPEDCRFCDYAAVCRAKVDDYGKPNAPLAEWSKETRDEVLNLLREVRGQ